jgi:Abi-like protein
MDLAKHEYHVSRIRLSRYCTAYDGDATRATALYKGNIQLSQAYYPVISILEVSLRNAINREIADHFLDEDWLLTQRNNFANHPLMTKKDKWGKPQPDHFFGDKLVQVEKKLRYRGVPFTHGKLLADLTFGFWVKFFDASPIKILMGAHLRALKNRPALSATKIHSQLNRIVELRNRISHNEPICFNKAGRPCFVTMENYEAELLSAIGWIDIDLRLWAAQMSFVRHVLRRIGRI